MAWHGFRTSLGIMAVVAPTACSFHVSTGAGAIKQNYRLRLNAGPAPVRTLVIGLHPARDVGGSLSAGVTASTSAVDSLTGLRSTMDQTPVPGDFTAAHGRLMSATAELIEAFRRRNVVIQTHNEAGWAPANHKIQVASGQMNSAIKELESCPSCRRPATVSTNSDDSTGPDGSTGPDAERRPPPRR
jgi:hypothetical protein